MANKVFHQVTSFTDPAQPDNIYFEEDGVYAKGWVTDDTGAGRRIGHTPAEIVANLDAELGSSDWQTAPTAHPRYNHTQGSAAATWTIVHNFGQRPFTVHVVDTSGDDVIGDITHPDLNTTQIDFSAAFAGEAYLGA